SSRVGTWMSNGREEPLLPPPLMKAEICSQNCYETAHIKLQSRFATRCLQLSTTRLEDSTSPIGPNDACARLPAVRRHECSRRSSPSSAWRDKKLHPSRARSESSPGYAGNWQRE